jgi:hypothetical protein
MSSKERYSNFVGTLSKMPRGEGNATAWPCFLQSRHWPIPGITFSQKLVAEQARCGSYQLLHLEPDPHWRVAAELDVCTTGLKIRVYRTVEGVVTALSRATRAAYLAL